MAALGELPVFFMSTTIAIWTPEPTVPQVVAGCFGGREKGLLSA
jgi:hypothetical protein